MKQHRCFCGTVVFLVCLFGSLNLFADCKAPHYRIGQIHGADTAPSILLDISIRPEDFAPNRLICLAGVLRQKYRAPVVTAGIFSSHKAAVNYQILGSDNPKHALLWASKRHAVYYNDSEAHEEYLLLIPDGLSLGVTSPFNTRIDLPAVGKPSCKLEINNRCLFQFEHMGFPADAEPGAVTLTGRIERSGKVTIGQIEDVRPAAASSPALDNFARRNLANWRFEPSHDVDDIRIRFSLKRVDTPLEHGIDVQFALPDRVDIKIGPMLIPRQ